MKQKECVAMILAGGNGERLGALTKEVAKPVVHYGGKYRIIDFTLSNCMHSGIDTLGVLTQYEAFELHDYIGNGDIWGFNLQEGGAYMLPSSQCGGDYSGTANAVYQNIPFIERFDSEHVLILSGDHVYKMDYGKMLDFHKRTGADVTISVVTVPIEEASRFGIMSTSSDGKITEFVEKPERPTSNLASMGIYIFTKKSLLKYLLSDSVSSRSAHDFGKNIIPAMLTSDEKMYAYVFDGYWRDVGTVQSLWESNMDLIQDNPLIDLYDEKWGILTRSQYQTSYYPPVGSTPKRNILAEGCRVYGKVSSSVLFDSVTVCEGAEVVDSVVMPGSFIGKNAKVHKSIIGARVYIGQDAEIGAEDGLDIFRNDELCTNGISLVGPGTRVDEKIKIRKSSHVDYGLLPRAYNSQL